MVSPIAGRFGSVKARTRQVPVDAGRRDRHVEIAAAEALVGDDGAAILDAVRPLDHQRQRHAGRGDALAVAQQRRHVHGLAGAIDAALGIDEGIEPGRRRAAR